jgi:hypothetical protein
LAPVVDEEAVRRTEILDGGIGRPVRTVPTEAEARDLPTSGSTGSAPGGHPPSRRPLGRTIAGPPVGFVVSFVLGSEGPDFV